MSKAFGVGDNKDRTSSFTEGRAAIEAGTTVESSSRELANLVERSLRASGASRWIASKLARDVVWCHAFGFSEIEDFFTSYIGNFDSSMDWHRYISEERSFYSFCGNSSAIATGNVCVKIWCGIFEPHLLALSIERTLNSYFIINVSEARSGDRLRVFWNDPSLGPQEVFGMSITRQDWFSIVEELSIDISHPQHCVPSSKSNLMDATDWFRLISCPDGTLGSRISRLARILNFSVSKTLYDIDLWEKRVSLDGVCWNDMRMWADRTYVNTSIVQSIVAAD